MFDTVHLLFNHLLPVVSGGKRIAKATLLFLTTLLGMSPILRTLTKDTYSDTIWAVSTCLFVLNMLLHDYSSTADLTVKYAQYTRIYYIYLGKTNDILVQISRIIVSQRSHLRIGPARVSTSFKYTRVCSTVFCRRLVRPLSHISTRL